jgi:hypothetical protein
LEKVDVLSFRGELEVNCWMTHSIPPFVENVGSEVELSQVCLPYNACGTTEHTARKMKKQNFGFFKSAILCFFK